ncbi:MAG: transcription-repair coupling factor, partial [Bdellovibrio sp.]
PHISGLPTQGWGLRIELFGDQIESLRLFNLQDQRSLESSIQQFCLRPAREIIWDKKSGDRASEAWIASEDQRKIESSLRDEVLYALNNQSHFQGLEFWLPLFCEKPGLVSDLLSKPYRLWVLEPDEIQKNWDLFKEKLRGEKDLKLALAWAPNFDEVFLDWESFDRMMAETTVHWSSLEDVQISESRLIQNRSRALKDLTQSLQAEMPGSPAWKEHFLRRWQRWREEHRWILIFVDSQSQGERLKALLLSMEIQAHFSSPEVDFARWRFEQETDPKIVHLVLMDWALSESWMEESILLLKASDLLGKSARRKSAEKSFDEKARWLSFGDLKPGDAIVHVQHGMGVYEGLKTLEIQGIPTELVLLRYKDQDKLYLPVYRLGQIQKYSGLHTQTILDKLGSGAWDKTKRKVKEGVRDLARDLLVLYAERQNLQRPCFQISSADRDLFDSLFPFEETEDQWEAICQINKDFSSSRPMDRLVCGDVGFGKTEVALRATFSAINSGYQVAVLAPTTVLTFQHDETFRKRFDKFSQVQGKKVEIRTLNRFLSKSDTKKALEEIQSGQVHIVIGTHRLLSKDVVFKNLGLLILDEEQKFGVAHKEKLRKLRKNVDTLALSATPIPRTLNMSLLGIRDLSLIATPPVDRLPIRTFVTKWNDSLIQKGIRDELARGGQVFFIHNRIQSIDSVAEQLRELVPEARMRVAHGQMDEELLEKTMVEFFHHEIDILLCTAIVESGIDNPRANTMFIDQAQQMGLGQLYQLRGRVGRSNQRAYCYLLMPKNRTLEPEALERLKILQDHTALGSGLKVAQYDLELRGAGEILGENQSGHVDSVGFELYQDLLKQTLAELKGEKTEINEVEPEINLRIPSLIPEKYMQDVRLRLAYYKAMNDIKSTEDADRIELDLRDQFGPLPEEVVNLLGVMLIRSVCKILCIRDLSAGVKTISLIFTENTPLKMDRLISLISRENKKYSLTPDHRLNIRMNTITWPLVYEELLFLSRG